MLFFAELHYDAVELLREEEGNYDSDSLFSMPSQITRSMANQLQDSIRVIARAQCNDDLDQFYPSVVLSYATGSREGVDEHGAGPGLVYVTGLMRVLFGKGIANYSGLTLPVGRNWEVFKMRLVKRGKALAKMLIVLLTPAFYRSMACLSEVSLAAEFHIPVIPLRFEDALPGRSDQWSTAYGVDSELMVERAQRVLSGRNTIPARGCFVDDLQANINELLVNIRLHL